MRHFWRSAVITLNRLLSNVFGKPIKEKLIHLSSDKKRIAYLAEATGLKEFPQYLTLLFEIDALFCNDDRHLNNIAALEKDGKFSYCPIFDNGAGLLSNTQILQMDIAPKALLPALRAKPFNTTFSRQMNAAGNLYGRQFMIPKQDSDAIRKILKPLLEFYAQRDRGIIAGRVAKCILVRQKFMQ